MCSKQIAGVSIRLLWKDCGSFVLVSYTNPNHFRIQNCIGFVYKKNREYKGM